LESGDSDGNLSDALGAVEEVQIVLALQATLVNYRVHEMQLQDLMAANPSEESVAIVTD
jgi:hypothetical protein